MVEPFKASKRPQAAGKWMVDFCSGHVAASRKHGMAPGEHARSLLRLRRDGEKWALPVGSCHTPLLGYPTLWL